MKIIIRGEKRMEKSWYKSLTYWGAIGFGVVAVLEGLTSVNPQLALYAKTLTAILTALGIRRAQK